MSNQTKKCYLFNADGEYAGEGIAYQDPMQEEHYPLPHNSTFTQPPTTKAGEVARWVKDKWEVVADHRGETVYSTTNGQPLTVDYIGDLKAEHINTAPPDEWHEWVSGKWVQKKLSVSDLSNFLSEKDAEVDNVVRAKIAEGFVFDKETFSLSLEAQSNWGALALTSGDKSISTKDGKTYLLTENKKTEFIKKYREKIEQAQKWGREAKEKLRKDIK